MQQADGTVELVRSVVDAVSLPVTIKMRLGWDERSLTAPWFARAFEEVGVAAIAIHGRTREQGFSGGVDLDGLETRAAQLVRHNVTSSSMTTRGRSERA